MNPRVLVLVGLVGVMAWGFDPLPETVAAYRGRYEALKGNLDAKRDLAIGKAVGVYKGELQALLANVRQQGNLDYVVAIQAELKRLETDPTAPKRPAAKSMKHLRRAQGGARLAEDKARETHNRSLAKLREGYSGSLRALEKRLVAANEIEEAKLARAERAKIPKPVKKPTSGPKEEPKAKPVPRSVKKPVTTTIDALIDGDTYLVISDGGIQWSCRLNVDLVGKTGHKSTKPTRVNGEKWRPKWGKPIKEHSIRKSDVYPVKGLAGPISVTVLSKREGAKPATYTNRLIYIRDPEPGASWYEIEITHGG